MTRVASAYAYPEDYPSGSCDKHVLVEMCSGGGTPTEWCEKFKELDAAEHALAKLEEPVEIEEAAYLVLSESEYNAAARAVGVGLDKEYLNEEFVFVKKSGEEMELEECPVHTQEAWEAYLKAKEEEEQKKQEEALQQQLQQQLAGLIDIVS